MQVLAASNIFIKTFSVVLILLNLFYVLIVGKDRSNCLMFLMYCTARQCSPLRRKIMECCIITAALSLLMKHLVIGQRQKAPTFSAFHWSPHGRLVSIGQHFVTSREVHLPKRLKQA